MSSEYAGMQASLFPDAELSVVYEQPLNERIRNCLRLEHLFVGIERGISAGGEWDARDALGRMLEICDFLSRSDIRGELSKELERQVVVLDALRDNPGVNTRTLTETVGAVNDIRVQLKAPDYLPGQTLRNDELASQVRQRIAIPGGTCSFDVPALHYWLNADPALRTTHLNDWMRDLRTIEKATTTILTLIRESGHPRMITAHGGFYQQQVESNSPCQIVRVVMPPNSGVYPEISGGKHRFTVRFFAQKSTASRAVQFEEDIRFELQCCGL